MALFKKGDCHNTDRVQGSLCRQERLDRLCTSKRGYWEATHDPHRLLSKPKQFLVRPLFITMASST